MASMASPLSLLLLLLLISLLFSPTLSLTCTSQKLNSNKLYQNCNDLSSLSSYLHWSYSPSNKSLSVAFLAPPPSGSGWISWAINPTAAGMVGAQSLVAYKSPNGSFSVSTFKLNSYSSIVHGALDFAVSDASADFDSATGIMSLYATLSLPQSLASSGKINHIWQVGPSVSNDVPAQHDLQPANRNAKATLDLNSGSTTAAATTGVDKRTKNKNIHGVLNAVSWGILFPFGAVISRYLRTFESADPAWFYLHVSCQLLAYGLGVAGWATGLKLGSESKGIVFTTHRYIGIALFCFATIQIFALLLRPKKDHKYRFYWNVYHHLIGYGIIVLGIVNVFQGFDILQPEHKWKSIYVTVLIVLGVVSVLLEAVTWVVVWRRKSSQSTKPYA